MEEWKDVTGYPGYQVSSEGRVRSFWKQRKRKGTWGGKERILTDDGFILSQSDDGNGYMKVYLQNDTKRICKKVHRLVAEEFIPNNDPEHLDTVDHIVSGREGKLDNSVKNLRWMSRADNIRKAFNDGVCDEAIARHNKRVMCLDKWTGLNRMYDSIKEASEDLGICRESIHKSLKADDDRYIKKQYSFYEPDREDILLNRGLCGDEVWHP